MADTNHENRGLRALCATYDDWLFGIDCMLNNKSLGSSEPSVLLVQEILKARGLYNDEEELYMKLDDLTFDFNKMQNNKNDCISRKGAMQAICEILMDAPDSEFQEGEMAGMIRAMKAVKNVSGIEPPKAEIIRSSTIRQASLLDVITHTCNKFSLYPARYSQEDIWAIINAIVDAGYVIGRKEET